MPPRNEPPTRTCIVTREALPAERLLRRVRRRWLAGIRRVLTKPIDSVVDKAVATKAAAQKEAAPANLRPVRITTDPDAPALQPQEFAPDSCQPGESAFPKQLNS